MRSDGTRPVEFKPADYQPLFGAAGIPEADAGAFVARELLPSMKRACEVARTKIREVEVVHDDNDCYHGAKFETVEEFRVLFRYASFVDAFVDLNALYDKYYFVGPGSSDGDYYAPSLSLPNQHITSKRIGEERCKKLKIFMYPEILFDRLCCDWGRPNKRYFAQREELFAAIEERFGANNSQDDGPTIQG